MAAWALAACQTGKSADALSADAIAEQVDTCQEWLRASGLETCYLCEWVYEDGMTVDGTLTGVSWGKFSAGLGVVEVDTGDTAFVAVRPIPGAECDECLLTFFSDLKAQQADADQRYDDCRCGELTAACAYEDDEGEPAYDLVCLQAASTSATCDYCDVQAMIWRVEGMSSEEIDERLAECVEPSAPPMSAPPPPAPVAVKLGANVYRVDRSEAEALFFGDRNGTLWQIVDDQGRPVRVRVGYLPLASRARELGLSRGDVIARAGDTAIVTLADLSAALGKVKDGGSIRLRIVRKGVVVELSYWVTG